MTPSMTPPRTPFSTPLSGSVKEARLRLLHILQGPKKGPPAPLAALLVAAALLPGSALGRGLHLFDGQIDPVGLVDADDLDLDLLPLVEVI